MKSLAKNLNLFTTLSQNLNSSNQTLGLELMTDRHRYLLQRFFDNERTYQSTTVGGASLTTTASLLVSATSATLSVSWAYPTVSQLVTFSNGDQRTVLFTNGSTAISWTGGLSSAATTAITSVGVQRYAIPAVISKITNDFIQVGQLRFVPAPVATREEWDSLNFLPYTSDIVNYFFLYNGFVEFFPIPSTTGNIIQFNYKARVLDFSTVFLFSDTSGTAFVGGQAAFDYQKGTLSGISAGSTSITGSSTSWNTTGKFPLNVDVSYFNLFLNIAPMSGDGIWYPISQFNSDTSLTLATPLINAPSATATTYSIGQLPLLSEDFHDMLPNNALMTYFSSIVKDPEEKKEFEGAYNEKFKMLEEYEGSKTVQVDLQANPQYLNPNLVWNGH